jgi:exonuclease III
VRLHYPTLTDGPVTETKTKQIMEQTDVMQYIELTDIYRTFHPNTKKYTFFSTSHKTFSKLIHILVHKASLKRYKKIEKKKS